MSRKPQQESSYTETSTYRVRPRRRVKIHLDPDLHDALKLCAQAHGVSLAHIVRIALEYALAARPHHASPCSASLSTRGGN